MGTEVATTEEVEVEAQEAKDEAVTEVLGIVTALEGAGHDVKIDLLTADVTALKADIGDLKELQDWAKEHDHPEFDDIEARLLALELKLEKPAPSSGSPIPPGTKVSVARAAENAPSLDEAPGEESGKGGGLFKRIGGR